MSRLSASLVCVSNLDPGPLVRARVVFVCHHRFRSTKIDAGRGPSLGAPKEKDGLSTGPGVGGLTDFETTALGNDQLILCERGVFPIDRAYTRNTLDLSIVPVLKEHSHLPVIVDPSHGTGVAKYVAPMAKAAMIAGADGVMIEMHPNPKEALSDGSQALTPLQFTALMHDLRKLAGFVGVSM